LGSAAGATGAGSAAKPFRCASPGSGAAAGASAQHTASGQETGRAESNSRVEVAACSTRPTTSGAAEFAARANAIHSVIGGGATGVICEQLRATARGYTGAARGTVTGIRGVDRGGYPIFGRVYGGGSDSSTGCADFNTGAVNIYTGSKTVSTVTEIVAELEKDLAGVVSKAKVAIFATPAVAIETRVAALEKVASNDISFVKANWIKFVAVAIAAATFGVFIGRII